MGDFRRANQGGRGRARTDGDHHVIGGVKVQGVYGTLVVAEEATGHHRPDGLMVQDNHRERACFAPDIMNLSGRMGLHSTERTDKNTAESFRRGTTLSVGPREGDAWAMLGDSAFTQSSYYIARLRVYILTVCSASKGWADKRAGREAARSPLRDVHRQRFTRSTFRRRSKVGDRGDPVQSTCPSSCRRGRSRRRWRGLARRAPG